MNVSEMLTTTRYELAQSKVELFLMKQSRKLRRAEQEEKFKSAITPETQQEHDRKAGVFAAEFLEYLFQNLEKLLIQLSLEPNQIEMINFLLAGLTDETRQTTNELVLEDTTLGLLEPTKDYFIGKTHSVGTLERPRPERRSVNRSAAASPYTSFHINWSVTSDFPRSASIYGMGGFGESMPKSIYFLFFPSIPDEAEVYETIGARSDEKTAIDMYDQGRKIVIRQEFKDDDETGIAIEAYYLLEKCKSTQTEKDYNIVYGLNSGKSTQF